MDASRGDKGAGQGLGQQQELAGAGGLVGGGHPGPVLEEAALAGSFWWVELPGPGVRKATSTHYSPKAYVLGLMGNILSMASLQGPAVEKDGLWQPLLSPQKTLSLVENDFFTPQTFSRVEKRGRGSPAWPLPSAGSDHCTERERAGGGVCAQGTDRPGHRNKGSSIQAGTSPSMLPGTPLWD